MRGLVVFVALAVLAACTAPSAGPADGGGTAASTGQQAPARKALSLALTREPTALDPSLQPMNREWASLASAFFAYFSPETQAPVPFLAEELPALEKGTWKILPDGRMETTYTIKKTAVWHDGQPITSHDWVFGLAVRTDPNAPAHSINVEKRLAQAVALDDHTLFLEWREAYLWAGMIHVPDFPPLARHKMQPLYEQDPIGFFDGLHWREEFVGSGPFRVERWEPGVEIVFKAHDRFVLGRPHLDEVRVRLIGDANTVVANLLSGSLDMAFSNTIDFPQAQALERAGWTGKIEYWPGLPRYLEFQGRDWGNTSQAVFDVRVRRAAHYAIDRKSIADIAYDGRAFVAYYWLSPIDPSYPAVERAVPRYEYDPNRAQALLREAGWTRGDDGRARNAAGQQLSIPMQNLPPESYQQEAAIVIDNWKAIGITSDLHRLSPQEWRDNELRAKIPGVAYNSRNLGLETMVWMSQNLSRPENRWGGQNRIGYINPRLDELWTRVLASVDPREREGWLVEGIRVMMDDAMVVLTHIMPDVIAYDARLTGLQRSAVVDTSRVWNIWEWRWSQ